MSTFININHKPPEYGFADNLCHGRKCFHPKLVGVNSFPACSNRANHGCPDPLPPFETGLAAKRHDEGWRIKP